MKSDTMHKHENENTKLVSDTIKKYGKSKKYSPVKNVSVDIESENTVYKLTRLDDEQYYQLRKNSIAILDDYGHLMSLYGAKKTIYSSLSKMYTILKLCFGESGKYYDDWKGSFSFPFLIRFEKNGEVYDYLMNIMNLRSSIEFNLRKLVFPDDESDRMVMYEPFEDFPRPEIRYVINFFVGYLSGIFKATSGKYDELFELFFHTVGSNLILFGYDGTDFFDVEYDNEEEYEEAVKGLEKKMKISDSAAL